MFVVSFDSSKSYESTGTTIISVIQLYREIATYFDSYGAKKIKQSDKTGPGHVSHARGGVRVY